MIFLYYNIITVDIITDFLYIFLKFGINLELSTLTFKLGINTGV